MQSFNGVHISVGKEIITSRGTKENFFIRGVVQSIHDEGMHPYALVHIPNKELPVYVSPQDIIILQEGSK